MAAVGTAQWSSRFAFIMAAVGSSVGLGNLWRFSAEAGTNGGGAFILIYLLCIALVGLPVLMSEYVIGRAGQASSAVKSMDDLNDRGGTSHGWSSGAWLGMIASFLIVSFYCVVAAWVMAYIPKFMFGAFDGQTAEQIAGQFGQLVGEKETIMGFEGKWTVTFWFFIFAILTTFLVSRGVNRGIEIAAKYLMPIFFILLIGLAAYAIISTWSADGAKQAFKFLFTVDFSKIDGDVANSALGQACFSLGIGNAIMITYGSYLPRNVNIPKAAITVSLTDTLVAMVAGFAIFPIVFANGLDFNAGAGIFFQTLPTALSSAPGGNYIGVAFFFLAFFAAITSSVSLLEPTVAWVAEHFKWTKRKAAWITGGVMMALGLVSVNYQSFFDFIDTGLVGPIVAPLSAFLVVFYAGHRMKKQILFTEMEADNADNGFEKTSSVLNPFSLHGVGLFFLAMIAAVLLASMFMDVSAAPIFFIFVTFVIGLVSWWWAYDYDLMRVNDIKLPFYSQLLFFLVRYIAPAFIWIVLIMGTYSRYFAG